MCSLVYYDFHKSHKGHSNNGLGQDLGTITNTLKACCAMSR